MERHGRLLLVEDEHGLRGLVAQFLRGARYHVIEARDGREAIDRFTDSGPFDLALVDLNLPVFSGVEVCRRILAACPDQKILICSAAITAEFERALYDLGIDRFLTKPYHPEALLAQVRRALDNAASTWAPISAVAGRA
jgi:two-component system KDP operon response regulator KdpE